MKILFYVSDDPLPINNGVTVAIAGLAEALSKYLDVYIYNYKKDSWYKIESMQLYVKNSHHCLTYNYDIVICSPLLSIKHFILNTQSKIKHTQLLGFVSDNYTYVLWRNIVVSWKVKQLTLIDFKSFFKLLICVNSLI